MSRRDTKPEGVEDLSELAQLGASQAADVLADLIGRRVLRCAPQWHRPEDFQGREEWSTGVFCDVGGAHPGVAAVFLTALGQDGVLKALCGSDTPPREFAASALSEFGNMLSSRALSAIADRLGELLLPGLPDLATTGAASLFHERLASGEEFAETLCVESELFEEESGLRVLVVLALHEPHTLATGGEPGAASQD